MILSCIWHLCVRTGRISMGITENEFAQAQEHSAIKRQAGCAITARYDRRTARVVVGLANGVHVTFPVHLAEGLSEASPDDLVEIEISPGGLGLHWPRLDADVYVPALLQGVFGSPRWMAAQLGASGGRARTESKTSASRENGRKGGRPRRATA
jgi:hypothetical protein